jgi:signal transduction histidine kinase
VRSLRLGLFALLVVAGLVGASPPAGARTVAYFALLAVASAAWLAWTFRPSPDDAFPASLAVTATAGALLLTAGGRSALAIAAVFAVIAVSTAVHRLQPGSAAIVAVSALAAFAVAALATGVAAAALGMGCILVGIPAGLVQREHRRRADQAELLLAEAQRTREEQARGAVLHERVRVSREVHDVLAHTLAGLAIQLESAEALLADAHDPDRALEVVRRSRGLVVDGIDETRRAVAALRGDEVSLGRGLADLVESARAQGSAASLEVAGPAHDLPPDMRLALLRIAREALTNVRRHAPDSTAVMRLDHVVGLTTLTIANTVARSPQPTGGAGYGITGMRERASLVGGELTAQLDGDVFTVRVTVPA